MPTATSLPITCAASIVSASHCVGLTLPGMIELPGSFSGIVISPKPERGPLASQRTSFAIFVSAPASAAQRAVQVHQRVVGGERLELVRRGDRTASRCTSAISAATRSPNSGCVLSPVPTAVPPSASSQHVRQRRLDVRPRVRELRRVAGELLAERQRRRVLQVRAADLDDVGERRGLRRRASRGAPSSAGSRLRVTVSAAATFIAVGNTSFDDWPRLTSSFGCTSRPSPRGPPRSSEARLASTSLTFMLVCVPEPVCQTASGNSPACSPGERLVGRGDDRVGLLPAAACRAPR